MFSKTSFKKSYFVVIRKILFLGYIELFHHNVLIINYMQ